MFAALWGAETMAEIILAFNRCAEICSPRFADYLFKGYSLHYDPFKI
jgi:hypothetical protein